MVKQEGNTRKKKTLIKETPKPLNDGMNTPVPDKIKTKVLSVTEKALFKQAENPLGDPNKV